MRNWGLSGDKPDNGNLPRRAVIAGLLATGVLTLPGWGMATTESVSSANSADDAVRRLLVLATQRAFAKLVQPDGYWDSAVARVTLPELFRKPGKGADPILHSASFKEQLQHHLNQVAVEGARKVAALADKQVRTVPIANGDKILRGRPTAATTYLRQTVGAGPVNTMITVFDEVMRANQDPVLRQAISGLKGVTVDDAAHALAIEAENATWYAIGAAESEIRANPSISNDPALIEALRPRQHRTSGSEAHSL